MSEKRLKKPVKKTKRKRPPQIHRDKLDLSKGRGRRAVRKIKVKPKTKTEKIPVKEEKLPEVRAGTTVEWNLNDVRKELLRLKEEILFSVELRGRDEELLKKDELIDEVDHSIEERQKELSLMLGERERAKLHEIEGALKRIEEKTYGICEDCGINISAERLKFIPYARFCVDCQERLEQEQSVERTSWSEEEKRITPPSLSGADEEEN